MDDYIYSANEIRGIVVSIAKQHHVGKVYLQGMVADCEPEITPPVA